MATARKLSNADARLLFLNSAIRKCQWVNPPQALALGTTLTAVMPKSGIIRGLLVTVNVPITIGTAALTPSPKGPFNLFTNVHLQDYSGIDRVNCSAYMLDQLQQMKKSRFQASDSWPYNYAQASTPYGASTFPFELMPPYNAPPSWATAAGTAPGQNCFDWKIPTATGNDNLCFAFWVPVAFDMHDPRGALLANIPNGQIVLQLTVNNALTATSGVDTPYTSATGTCVFNSATSSNVTIYCYSWDPVAVPGVPTDEYVGGLPIPYDDLQLVHEIRSITDPTGMAASTEKIYTMPSGRDYYRVIASVVENGTFNTSHLTRTRWIYDGSTPTTDEYIAGFLHRNKLEKGRLPSDGTLWYDFSNRPWDANSYGSLGWGITTSSSFVNTSPTYTEYCSDALYMATMSNA